MQISNHFISSIRAGLAVIFQIFYAMNYFLYLHVKSLCVVVMPDLWWLSHQIMYVCHYVWSYNSTLCSMEPQIDEEPEIVHPGPEITSLLMQQTNHQSEIIWNGEVKYLVFISSCEIIMCSGNAWFVMTLTPNNVCLPLCMIS